MKIYWNTQPCGFIKGEMFWYIIKDGGGEDIGKENIFFFGGGGEGNLKNDGFIFPHIQSRSKPYTDDVLRYLNIKGPSKHSCTWWYKESKNLTTVSENNCSKRQQQWRQQYICYSITASINWNKFKRTRKKYATVINGIILWNRAKIQSNTRWFFLSCAS